MSYLWNVITGQVGQYLESELPASAAVSLASNVATDVTSLALPAGDWHVWGAIVTRPENGAVNFQGGWIGTASATIPVPPNKGAGAGTLDNFALTIPVGQRRIVLAAPATVYLSALAVFTGTCGAYGILCARRMA
jgi:hypothetical protein